MVQADCPAYVLSGGRSSRFGSDKALVEIGGEILLLRLVRVLEAQGHAVSVVADRTDRYQELGLQCLVDLVSGRGPLAGLATALEHRAERGPGWILLISCDQLKWTAAWFRQLAVGVNAERETLTFVESDSSAKVLFQPIPGLYHTRLLPQVRASLSTSRLSLRSLISSCNSLGIDSDDNPRNWSFNTLDDLRHLEARLAKK